MNKNDIKRIIDKNPHVDKKSFKDGINAIRKFRGISRSKSNVSVPYSKKAKLIDDRDELRVGQVSFQQY